MSTHTVMTRLVEVYALDSLEGLERIEFESHLAACDECDRQLAKCEEALAALVPDEIAPRGIWDEVSEALDQPAKVSVLPPRNVSIGTITAVAAVVAIALGGIVLTQRSTSSSERLVAAAESAAQEPGATVTRFTTDGVTVAEVVLTIEGMGYLLPTSALPALESNRTYQLWVVNEEGAVISGGVLGSDPKVSAFTWTDGVTGLILTRERAGGVETSEGDVVSVIGEI